MPIRHRRLTAALRIEMVVILRDGGNAWMAVGDIAAAVNERGECRRPDGREITIQQVSRQTRNYASLFERQGSNVRLRVDVYLHAAIPLERIRTS